MDLQCCSVGSSERHKARLVTQGFHPQADINYHKTFSPLSKRLMFAFFYPETVSFCSFIPWLDVKNALQSNGRVLYETTS